MLSYNMLFICKPLSKWHSFVTSTFSLSVRGSCNGLECSSRLHLVPHMSFAVYWHLQCMMLSCAASRSPPSLSAQPKCPLWEFSLYGNPLYYRCSFSYNFIYTPNWIFLPWNEASVEDIEEQNKDHLWSSPRTRVLGLSHFGLVTDPYVTWDTRLWVEQQTNDLDNCGYDYAECVKQNRGSTDQNKKPSTKESEQLSPKTKN